MKISTAAAIADRLERTSIKSIEWHNVGAIFAVVAALHRSTKPEMKMKAEWLTKQAEQHFKFCRENFHSEHCDHGGKEGWLVVTVDAYSVCVECGELFIRGTENGKIDDPTAK